MEAVFKNWFPNAVANTFVGSAILAVSGGLCAFLLRRNANASRVAMETETPAGSAAGAAVAQAGDA